MENEKLKKIYKIKKILKNCSLSPEEYEKIKPPSTKFDGWISDSGKFKGSK